MCSWYIGLLQAYIGKSICLYRCNGFTCVKMELKDNEDTGYSNRYVEDNIYLTYYQTIYLT